MFVLNLACHIGVLVFKSSETPVTANGKLIIFCYMVCSYLVYLCQGKEDVKNAAVKEEKEEKHSDQQGRIAFFCGNPMVEIIKGIIHIYKNK